MLGRFHISALAALVLASALGAQTIVNDVPAVIGFVDLTTNGGIPVVPAPDDDSEHNFVTIVGNALFPAGNVRLGNNGVVISGDTGSQVSFGNGQIPATGPAPFQTGTGAVCAYWDDLLPVAGVTEVRWKEESGVLFVMFKEEHHFGVATTNGITFEIQVFSAPAPGAPAIQIIYPNTTFGNATIDHGASATVGYARGTNPVAQHNAQWSFNTPAVPSGTVLSILEPGPFRVHATSPSGPGSIKLTIFDAPLSGTYFLAATLAPGQYPNGWLFGLDISYAELASELATGFPFTGPLDAMGHIGLGPFQGLPPVTVYGIAFGFPTGSSVPSVISDPFSHTVP